MYHVVVSKKLLQSWECMCDRKVADTIPATVEDFEVDKLAALFREFGHLIPDENELFKRSQLANFLWELRNHIERYIQVPEGEHVAYDGREAAEFIIGDSQCLKHPQPGEVPGKMLHAIVLQPEDG